MVEFIFQAAARGPLPTLRPPLTLRARSDKKQKRSILHVCIMYGIRLAGDFSVLWRCRMAIGAEAVRSTELPLISGEAPRVNARRVRQARCAEMLLARIARGGHERPMGASKYENSLDNRCAAMVSREPRASRARQNCKPCMANGLRLVSRLIRARGAHVSRAARGHLMHFLRPVSRPARRALSSFAASRERRPPKMRTCPERESKGCHSMSHECHTQSDGIEFLRGSTAISYVIQMRPVSRIFPPRASFWDIL